MPVRNMLYDAMQYNQQVTEIAEKHKGKKGGKRQQKISTGEFLSGFYKNNKLIPVITLVLFFKNMHRTIRYILSVRRRF